MKKPITIARQEFIEKMVEAINTSGLSFFIIEPILKDLLESVRQGIKGQEEKERAEYEDYLKKEADKNNAETSENNSKPSKTEG